MEETWVSSSSTKNSWVVTQNSWAASYLTSTYSKEIPDSELQQVSQADGHMDAGFLRAGFNQSTTTHE